MDFVTFSERCKNIKPWELLKPILIAHLPELEDANTTQLRRGELNDGDLLEYYKSPIYADFKESLATYKAPSGIPDTFLTGDFHESIFAEVNDKGVLFDAKDWKRDKLVGVYSIDLFGVQPDEFKVILDDQIVPEFITALQNYLLN